MANHLQCWNEWSDYEAIAKQEFPRDFSFPNQRLPPLHHTDLSEAEIQCDLGMHRSEFNDIPLMDMFGIYSDPLYASLDILPIQNNLKQGDYFCSYRSGSEELDDQMMWEFHESSLNYDQPPLLLCNNNDKGTTTDDTTTTLTTSITNVDMNRHGNDHEDDKKRIKSCSREPIGQSSTKMLTREEISEYFYVPITQAAKELNVGLTFLKKKCRELGIRRWPRRKLMSIETLIKSVKELRKEEEVTEEKLGEDVMILEQEKKLMEEAPDLQLTEDTKRLRQASFKANYKRRKNTVDTE